MKQFKTESKRILDLMINSIYTNKEIFLRELISNASDAIDKLKFISLTDGKAVQDFNIYISADKTARTLCIEDNGIGMTDKDLEKNLGTIAESGTLAFKKQNDGKTDEELIGQFGVGFYSAFMVADKVEVLTKAYGSETAYLWESKGADGYTITSAEKDGVGTKITLYLKDDGEDYKYSEFLEQYKISSLIKRYSDYIRYPIQMNMTRSVLKDAATSDKPEYDHVTELTTLNSMVPLWKKPKAQVTDEQLAEFYKSEFHDFNAPLKSVYAKIEGAVTYDTLLFFPEKVSFDYYTKDFKKGLKLYCNGVMIMDKCEELLPDWLGFVRGIVDSSDLSLNISREILQQSRQVKAIANGIEKKAISELKKMMETDPESYAKLFAEVGLSIKFGAYSAFGANMEKLKDLLMFYSLKQGKLISLGDYVKAMADDQTEIYYACGESYDKIASLPQIEKAGDKNVDILFFKDGVDEFIIKLMGEWDGKKFKSISEADFNLNSDSEKTELEQKTQENKPILEKLKELLGDKVKEVRLTANLKTYPVCIIAGGELSFEMEKVLNSMPNSDGSAKAERILEISANHPVLESLKNAMDSEEKMKNYATVLYGQACILEGLPLDDAGEFVKASAELI